MLPALSIFSIIAIFVRIPSGSLCGGERTGYTIFNIKLLEQGICDWSLFIGLNICGLHLFPDLACLPRSRFCHGSTRNAGTEKKNRQLRRLKPQWHHLATSPEEGRLVRPKYWENSSRFSLCSFVNYVYISVKCPWILEALSETGSVLRRIAL